MSGFVPGTEQIPTGPVFPYRDEPYKTLYGIYLVGKVLISLPYWALLAYHEGWRQSPNWSWGRSIGMRFIRLTDSVTYQ
jgi:hypothetical protein